jgi:hypothetical protein
MKEEYKVFSLVLKKINYQEHEWVICVDLKMVNFLFGQQSGYTKYPCFLCLWESRALGKKRLVADGIRGLSQKNPAIFNISRTGRVALMKLGSQSEETFLRIHEYSPVRLVSR